MRPVLFAFFLVPVLVVGQPARASDVPIDVKIRVETFGRLSPSSVMRMRQEVENIWQPASVRLVWTVFTDSVHPGEDATDRTADITILIEHEAPWPDYAPSPETLAQSTLYHPPDGSRFAVIVTSIERTRLVVERMLKRTDQPLARLKR